MWNLRVLRSFHMPYSENSTMRIERYNTVNSRAPFLPIDSICYVMRIYLYIAFVIQGSAIIILKFLIYMTYTHCCRACSIRVTKEFSFSYLSRARFFISYLSITYFFMFLFLPSGVCAGFMFPKRLYSGSRTHAFIPNPISYTYLNKEKKKKI